MGGNCISRVRNNHMDATTVDPSPPQPATDGPAAHSNNAQDTARDSSSIRPHAPADHPRASLLTGIQFEHSSAAHSLRPSPLGNVPPEMLLEVASHLPAKDKAALASTARAYHQTLPTAGQEHKQLQQLFRQFNAGHGRAAPQAIDDALGLLASPLHPADHEKLSRRLATYLQRQLSELSTGTRDVGHLKKTIEQSLALIDTSPHQSMGLASAISPLLNLTRTPALATTGLAASSKLRDVVTSAQPMRMTTTTKDQMAWTLRNMNLHGLQHLPEQERGAALEQHVSAMESLYATSYTPSLPMINPLSSAIRQVASLPAPQQAGIEARLDQLQRWAR
ncbi:hypothetical protein SAMN03159391_00408 [Pseudomonas sp. NFACC37-1]|nr:hypothetical protein SAMN03159391_00408 [Pseudomonas sp. NFACC37-1]SFO45394.1 hypothetical protein SAMN03159304_03419 [Pseudomonas sp. NFACC24-1]